MSQLPPIPINSKQIDENNAIRFMHTSTSSTASGNYVPQSINRIDINKNQQISNKRISSRLSNKLLDEQTQNTSNFRKHCIAETSETNSVSSSDKRLPTPDIDSSVSHILLNNTSSKKLIKKLSTSAPQSPRSSIGSCNSVSNSSQIFATTISTNIKENKELNLPTTTIKITTAVATTSTTTTTTKSTSSSSVSSGINYTQSRKYSDTFESSYVFKELIFKTKIFLIFFFNKFIY